MSVHSPTLLVAFAIAIVLASVVSIAIGHKEKGRRGARWWLFANALLTAALIVQAVSGPDAIAAPITTTLALQRPIFTLAGVRRFNARGGSRVDEWSDRALLALAIGAAGAGGGM